MTQEKDNHNTRNNEDKKYEDNRSRKKHDEGLVEDLKGIPQGILCTKLKS